MPEDWKSMMTPGGQPNAEYHAQWGMLSEGRFPVAPGDNERGRAALRLRGNGTTKAERKKILDTVARRCPELRPMVEKMRREDQEAGMI
jgi:hypothetical protein